MLIGFDGNEANTKNRVGVNTYAFELLKNLVKLQAEGENRHKLIVYLRNDPLPDMPEESANLEYKVIQGNSLWVIFKLLPELMFSNNRPDVFFTPSHYLPPLFGTPLVCSIMDLGYLEFSGQFTKKVFWQLKYWSAISISISKAVIAISDSTKNDIVRHYPAASKKTYVTHLAYDSKTFNTKIQLDDVRRVKNKYSIVDDYVLFLSTLKPSKNIEGLVQAFSSISKEYPKTTLVIAGKKGWMFEPIFKKARDLGLESRIIFTDFVADSDKAPLISGAKVFVLPSFWEGFGLDPLNAMACGVPVVVSNVGSLPEVVGDAGILVDPNNINSISEAIKKVLSLNKNDYNSMVEKGLTQAKKFSWERTAKQTLEILEKAVLKK